MPAAGRVLELFLGQRLKLPAIVRTASTKHPTPLPEGREAKAGENVIIRPTSPDPVFV
jgi:hypothetical protein